jgi:uncharacterized protein
LPEAPGGIPMPPHAYVPGRNARHPEDWFDAIKAGVTPDLSAAALADTAAWRAGLAYLDAGYFWECHEVLEAVWMQTPDPSPEREMVQAVIQLANARLKLRMDRPRATLRLCAMVEGHLARIPDDLPILELTAGQVRDWLDPVRKEAESSESAL